MAKSTKNYKSVQVLVQPELWHRVKIAAAKLDISASQYVRDALKEHLKKHPNS